MNESAFAPEGRVTIEGKITKLKWIDTDFGATQKMTVELANKARVYCSVPTKLFLPREGQQVKFTATFEQSKEDPTFAFGKMPKLWDSTQPEKKPAAQGHLLLT